MIDNGTILKAVPKRNYQEQEEERSCMLQE